jgi:hypothetical protein
MYVLLFKLIKCTCFEGNNFYQFISVGMGSKSYIEADQTAPLISML